MVLNTRGMVEVEAISVAPQLGETTRMALTASQEGNEGSSSSGGLSDMMLMVIAGSSSLIGVLGCGILLILILRCRRRG